MQGIRMLDIPTSDSSSPEDFAGAPLGEVPDTNVESLDVEVVDPSSELIGDLLGPSALNRCVQLKEGATHVYQSNN